MTGRRFKVNCYLRERSTTWRSTHCSYKRIKKYPRVLNKSKTESLWHARTCRDWKKKQQKKLERCIAVHRPWRFPTPAHSVFIQTCAVYVKWPGMWLLKPRCEACTALLTFLRKRKKKHKTLIYLLALSRGIFQPGVKMQSYVQIRLRGLLFNPPAAPVVSCFFTTLHNVIIRMIA